MDNEMTEESYIKFHNENDESSSEKRTNTEVVTNDTMEIVTMISHTPEIQPEIQTVKSFRFLVAFALWLGFFVVHGGRFGAAGSVAIEQFVTHYRSLISNEYGTGTDPVVPMKIPFIHGYIAISYLCGFILTGILGGFLASTTSATRLFLAGASISCLINVFYPVTAGNTAVLLSLHLFQGLSEGIILPAFFAICVHWFPPKERNIIAPIIYSGVYTGLLMASEFGREVHIEWTAVYTIFGFLALIWFVLWLAIFEYPVIIGLNFQPQNLPMENSFANILEQVNNVPWKLIFTSKPVWAIVLATGAHQFYGILESSFEIHYSYDLGFFMAGEKNDTEETDRYLQQFHIPFGITIISIYLLVFLVHLLDYKFHVSTIRIRKIFTCCGLCLQIQHGILMIFRHVEFLKGFIFAIPLLGYFLNPFDIAPKYASIIVGVSNSVGSFIGILLPLVAYALMFKQLTNYVYLIFLIIEFVLMLGVCIFYGIVASAEKQQWAK